MHDATSSRMDHLGRSRWLSRYFVVPMTTVRDFGFNIHGVQLHWREETWSQADISSRPWVRVRRRPRLKTEANTGLFYTSRVRRGRWIRPLLRRSNSVALNWDNNRPGRPHSVAPGATLTWWQQSLSLDFLNQTNQIHATPLRFILILPSMFTSPRFASS